jgi:hypothetical protein
MGASWSILDHWAASMKIATRWIAVATLLAAVHPSAEAQVRYDTRPAPFSHLTLASVTIAAPAGHILKPTDHGFGEGFCSGYLSAVNGYHSGTGHPESISTTWTNGLVITCHIAP